jgi:serine protease AprX
MKAKNTIVFLIVGLLFTVNSTTSQNTKYWVKFKDKAGTPYLTSNPNAFLSAKAINRRVFYSIPFDETDLPVTPAYISQIDNITDVTVLYASKWLNGVVVSIPNAALSSALLTISSKPFVLDNAVAVSRYALNKLEEYAVDEVKQSQALRPASTSSFNMGRSYWQNKQVNVTCLHEQGYRGQYMTIAVMDIGFNSVDTNPLFDSLRNRNGILGTRDFVSGGNSVYEDPSHGAHVLSCMAAIKPGLIMGSAPRADYWLLRTEEGGSETISEEYNWVRGAEFADSVGADILTTSLGYTMFDNSTQNHTYATLNGKTAPMSIAATMAARKGMFVLNAAGNEGGGGWNYVSVPADADSICTVGAIDTLGSVAGFSGVGPTADGRKKPDLVARGVGTWIGDVNGNCFAGNGTSFSTPVLAGAVACFWQGRRHHNNMTILQLLKSTASNVSNPDNSRGWGIPDVCSIPISIESFGANKFTDDFIVSPNPFNNIITVDVYNKNAKFVSLQIVDVVGKVYKQFNELPANSSIVVNTSDFANGIYFLQVQTTAGLKTKKIIKH